MKVEDLVERLTEFGLDPREARLFYHLARLGGARASEAAKAADLQRTEAYRLLDSLVNQGFVDRTAERPQRFLPRDVEDVLATVIAREEDRVRALEEIQGELAEAWPRGREEQADNEVRYAVVEGRTQIRGALTRLVQGARETVVLVALSRSLARMEELGLLEELERRRDEGVQVRALTEVVDRNRSGAKRWARLGELRHLPHASYHQALIVDNREIALFLTVDPRVSVSEKAEETVLVLNARDFVLSQKALADLLWAQGIDLEDRLEELDTEQVAEQVRVVRGRWSRYNQMKDMLYRAQREAWIVAPSPEVKRWKKTGLDHVLRERSEQGVRVHVLAHRAPPMELGATEVRVATPRALDGTWLLVDRSEALHAVASKGAGERVTEPDEWSTWTTVRSEVAQLQDRLERAWREPPSEAPDASA